MKANGFRQPLTLDEAPTARIFPRAYTAEIDHTLRQQTDNRLWLMQHRRWLRAVETIHLRRQMAGQWRWLYAMEEKQ